MFFKVILFLAILSSCLFFVNAIMIKRECPADEVHKSCAFHEEYTCWVDKSKLTRVKTPPKRNTHCRSGCFCKKGWVRSYPGGPCIVAYKCKNRELQEDLKKLPLIGLNFSQ